MSIAHRNGLIRDESLTLLRQACAAEYSKRPAPTSPKAAGAFSDNRNLMFYNRRRGDIEGGEGERANKTSVPTGSIPFVCKRSCVIIVFARIHSEHAHP